MVTIRSVSAHPDHLVTNEFAHETPSQSRVHVSTMVGDKAFVVRASCGPAFPPPLLETGRDLYLRTAVLAVAAVPRIDVKFKKTPGHAGRARFGPPWRRIRRRASSLARAASRIDPAVYAISMNVSSVFALFIGMFIIYNSFSIAVTQRRSEIGILRALGAPRRQIRNLFLIESAVSGLLGSVAGIALGIAMARAMVGTISICSKHLRDVAERAERVSAVVFFPLSARHSRLG